MYIRTVCALMTGCLAFAGPAAPDHPQDTPRETEAGLGCRVVMLKHADSELVARHVRSLFEGKDQIHKLTWYEPANAILMRAAPDELEQMEYLVMQLDVQAPAKEEHSQSGTTHIIQIKHADAERLAATVNRVLATCDCSRRHRECGHVKVHADKRTNVLMLHATDSESERMVDIIKVLDVPLERPQSCAATP